MKSYKKVVLALALNQDIDAPIISKALDVVETSNAELLLVHAIESVSDFGMAYGVNAIVNVDDILYEQATKILSKVAEELNVPADRVFLLPGPAKQVILDHAKDCDADLIILGSHGHRGVRLLLGSTSNAVLHHAHCDVLAVRL